jgi:hypothetical protein
MPAALSPLMFWSDIFVLEVCIGWHARNWFGLADTMGLLGAVMAARPMFSNMQPQWACKSSACTNLKCATLTLFAPLGTLLGCVALAMIPFSFLFYFKGESFRKRSRYAPYDK